MTLSAPCRPSGSAAPDSGAASLAFNGSVHRSSLSSSLDPITQTDPFSSSLLSALAVVAALAVVRLA